MNKFEQEFPQKLLAQVAECPTDPGVYVMKASSEKVLYVGKAKNLKNRVQSYFRKRLSDDRVNIKILLPKVAELEFHVTQNEVEALILESSLIKKWRPPYNIRLRDDKSYPYLKLDLGHDFPRVYYARRPQKVEQFQYFGPFPSSYSLKVVMDSASKLFQIRDCKDREFANRSRPCLSHQIGQCTAPCVGMVSKKEYAQQLNEFMDFLKGNNDQLIERWELEMSEASESMEFEKAAQLRDRLRSFKKIREEQQQNILGSVGSLSRDIWSMQPLLGQREAQESVDVLLMQIREGQWTGRKHFPVEEDQTIIDENTFHSLLTQYYMKNPLPDEVIVGDHVVAHKDWGVLFEVFQQIKEIKSSQEEKVDSNLKKVSDQNDFLKLWELVEGNLRLLHIENERLRQSKKDSLKGLKKLAKLKDIPERIECIDVSNMQGNANVASCVVFLKGQKETSEYRKFKIKSFEGQNDFASMVEVMKRRYLKEAAPRPDLLVVDGGKGQLSVVEKILKDSGIDFPVVALAKARNKKPSKGESSPKSEERLFLPGQKNAVPVKHPGALRLLTEIRDEAHRFAIQFHRKKRTEKMFS